MKSHRILFRFALIFFVVQTFLASTASLSEQLPDNLDLSNSIEGLIEINPPPNYQAFRIADVRDMNGDNYPDLLFRGSTTVNGPWEVIGILWGSPELFKGDEITIDSENYTDITWQSGNTLLYETLSLGDFNGDKKSDIAVCSYTGSVTDYYTKLYILLGDSHWKSNSVVSSSDPGIIEIYAFENENLPAMQERMIYGKDKIIVEDFNNDSIDDIFFSLPWKKRNDKGLVGQSYVVFGALGLTGKINAASEENVYTILNDTAYNFQAPITFSSAAGDFDGDFHPDLLFGGQYSQPKQILHEPDYSSFHSVSYMINNGLINNSFYRDNGLDLMSQVSGIFRFTRDADFEKYKYAETLHNFYGTDINGDAVDDLIITYTNSNGSYRFHLYSTSYVLFGNKNSTEIQTGNLDHMSKNGLLKLRSGVEDDEMGIKTMHGDINGDGFNDLLLATVSNSFYVLFGRKSYPDSLVVEAGSSNGVTAVSGGKFMACGDVNRDGYDDILGIRSNGANFILLGRGPQYAMGEVFTQSLSMNPDTRYAFQFSNNTEFGFSFTRNHPAENSQLHIANLGRTLPDSLGSIPSGDGVVSFFDAELTDIGNSYELNCHFGYTDSLLHELGIKEGDLSVSFWDEAMSQWTKVSVSRDTILNQISFSTDHLSLWALVDINDPIVASVDDEESSIPLTFELFQNYPNPFNPVTTIRYQVPQASEVMLRIYNILGQEIKTLINGQIPEGDYEVEWNGTDNLGRPVSSGVYIYRMTTDAGFAATRKMVLLK